MRYKINCWIFVEPEEEVIFDSLEEAQKELEHNELLQPENRYEIEEVIGNKAICLECKKEFIQERDIQLCDKCVKKFDLDKLWKLHDKNELDALDFNENKYMRERFRK